MGFPQTESPSSPHLYPEALQLKLYQAFIFSIPIFFSIILILLFYLFYLKRRASNLSTPSRNFPTATNHVSTYFPMACQLGLQGELKYTLATLLFDEELKKRETQCCVCLGEFEVQEELLQVPSCKHVFHSDCLHRWLHSNSTCPLCRCSVFPITKLQNQTSDSNQAEASTSSSITGSTNAESVVINIPRHC